MMGPHHLAKFDTGLDNFRESEEIFRRCPFGNRKPPFSKPEMFLDISWDEDLMKGLSVNRSKQSVPSDVLWSPISENYQTKKCEYQKKAGIVYKSKVKNFPIHDPKTGVRFDLKHSPINCNISHCDISISNLPPLINKPIKREIKAFLATYFEEITADEMSKTASLETVAKRMENEKNEKTRRPGCILFAFFFIPLVYILVKTLGP